MLFGRWPGAAGRRGVIRQGPGRPTPTDDAVRYGKTPRPDRSNPASLSGAMDHHRLIAARCNVPRLVALVGGTRCARAAPVDSAGATGQENRARRHQHRCAEKRSVAISVHVFDPRTASGAPACQALAVNVIKGRSRFVPWLAPCRLPRVQQGRRRNRTDARPSAPPAGPPRSVGSLLEGYGRDGPDPCRSTGAAT